MNKIIFSVFLLISPLPSVFTACSQSNPDVYYPWNSVKAYGKPDIADLIEDDEDYNNNEITKSIQNSRLVCNACKSVVDVIKDPTNAELITIVGKTICSMIPVVSSLCKGVINMYGNKIVPYLNAHTDDFVCHQIHACKVGNGFSNGRENDQDYCAECLYLMNNVEELIKEGKMDNMIDFICADLPEKEINKCTSVMHLISQILVSDVLTKMTSKDLCSIFHVCPLFLEESRQSARADLFFE